MPTRVFFALLCGLAITFNMASPSARAVTLPTGLVTSGPGNSRVVALIFDGGPSLYTSQTVDLLKSLYVPATFFFTGLLAPIHSSLLLTALADGDQIGDGGYESTDLQSLSTPAVVAEITRGQLALRRVTGRLPLWLSPPNGNVDARVIGIAASIGLRSVTWSLDSADRTLLKSLAIAQHVELSVQPGDIVLFHDGQPSPLDIAALPQIIHTLKRRGYRFATLDELFGLAKLPPCVPNGPELFGAAGIRASVQSSIYQSWLGHLCREVRFGPATSAGVTGSNNVITQNFARTGRQIVFDPATGSTHVVLMWSWGAAIFRGKKIKPRYGDPITKAWFSQYFLGIDEGAALLPERRYGQYVVQRFATSWAVESPAGVVSWQSHVDLNRFRSG